jgi:hypothetical protein
VGKRGDSERVFRRSSGKDGVEMRKRAGGKRHGAHADILGAELHDSIAAEILSERISPAVCRINHARKRRAAHLVKSCVRRAT